MSEAEKILNSQLTYGEDTYDAGQRGNILKAIKLIAELAFDAGDSYGYYIAGAHHIPKLNKEQFINQLLTDKP